MKGDSPDAEPAAAQTTLTGRDECYDAAHLATFFDHYGEREWERFEVSPAAKVSLFLHQDYLERFVGPGMHVLDAGAGPGRFTLELARRGARVTVCDLSAGQLAANRQRLLAAGLESAVESWQQCDITDLSRFADASFATTVCYGGPLSYVMERADDALAELLRVTQPGGTLLLSVMSKVGATRIFLPGVLELHRAGQLPVDHVLETGILPRTQNGGHALKLYSWAELEALLRRHPCEVVAASAANHLSTSHPEVVAQAAADPALWAQFLEWERRLCAEPGNLDGGTHILAAVRRL